MRKIKGIKILFFVFIFLSQTGFAQQPKLLVGIMVDGLKQAHIEQLWTRLDANGFKKLTREGAAFQHLACNIVSAGNPTDIATLLTGTVPYYHGVMASKIFNRNKQNIESIFFDRLQSGIDSYLTLSAKNLRSTTVVDELMMANQGKSKSYAIGIHPEDAIAMGGHTANGVVWLDHEHMNWSATDYYVEGMPWQALDMNSNGSFQRIIDRTWEPLYPPNTYLSSLNEKDSKIFSYKATEKTKKDSPETILKRTPLANALVAELALRIFQEEELGMDYNTDALMMQFTVRTPLEKQFSIQSPEKEDIYLRLDNELQFLMQKIEYKLGAENVLFVLFTNQTSSYAPEELNQHNIHAGYFNANRSMALLNSYLMAIFGPEKWIEKYYGKHVYLNRKMIEDKGLNYLEIITLAQNFLMEFEGIQSAHSVTQLMNIGTDPTSYIAKIRNSIHKNFAGDIILTLMPGWLEIDDYDEPVGESDALVSYMPFYMYGWKIRPQLISKQYYITDVAATLCDIMKLPYPNANLGKPMEVKIIE